MDFKLPDIGEGIHEGEVTKWLVKVGDVIQADSAMVEVMTDKATVEIPSPVTAVVKELCAKEGETVLVGSVLIRLEESGSQKTPSLEVEKNEPKVISAKCDVSKSSIETARDVDVIPSHVLATPATRKLARELKINLGEVRATGVHGRVTKLDVQMAYEGAAAAAPKTSHTMVAKEVSASLVKPVVFAGESERVALKGVRRKIADAMSYSKKTAAHFTYVEELDMSEIVSLRKRTLDEAQQKGIKLTFLPFIIKGLIPALQEFPYLNASLDDDKQEIILKREYHIGIATDTPNGLMVPVIKHADRKSIWQLAHEISVISEKARTGKLAVEDLKGGTFTVTNAGSIGGVFATPIINHPEVAILGVNAIRKRPVVKNDAIVIADVMFLSMSVDHRVVDGADAARFMNRLVYFLTDPTRLVFA